jgi:hypothetical protein
MISRGIGHVVAGKECESDPDRHNAGPANRAGFWVMVLRSVKKAMSWMKLDRAVATRPPKDTGTGQE